MPRSGPSISALTLSIAWGVAFTAGCAAPSPRGDESHARNAGNESATANVSAAAPSAQDEKREPSVSQPAAAAPNVSTRDDGARAAGALGESFACGPYACRRYSTLADAFVAVVNQEKPRILGVGESHAQASGPAVASTTARFTNDLLPLIADRTHSLVVELMAPNTECQKKTEAVREQQKEVVKTQASTNQNEFVTLGQKARSLGVVPFLLRPSCEDLAAITKAGNDDVLVMLETIARLTTKQVTELLASQRPDSPRRLVIAYGGALHNDLEPRAGRETFSYGPALRKLLEEQHAGTYVEMDLIVPELIQDGPTWRAMPWYEHYRADVAQGAALTMQLGPERWVLFAAKGAAAKEQSAPAAPPAEANVPSTK